MRGVREAGLASDRARQKHPALRGRRRTGLFLAGLIASASVAVLAACGIAVPAPGSPTSDAPAGDGALHGELRIFAAASLVGSFTALTDEFAADNPGVTVQPTSFDGSSTLALQIREGAPADVFASANRTNMEKVESMTLDAPQLFATNILQIAVQPGNPLGITELADLANQDTLVVLCAPEVPCGFASHKILDLEGVEVTPVSEEQNVKAVLAKVEAGEADAGLVYVTDVTAAAGSVDGVDIAGAQRAANSYPIAVMKSATSPEVARAFVDFVLSAEGQDILARFGFSAS